MGKALVVLTEFACAALNIGVGIANFGSTLIWATVTNLVVGGVCLGYGLTVLFRKG